MPKSSGRTKEISVMEMEEWPQANLQTIKRLLKFVNGGTPCAMKVACTVWSGGKSEDNIKGLPITIDEYGGVQFLLIFCQPSD